MRFRLSAIALLATVAVAGLAGQAPATPSSLSTLKLLQFNVLQGATDGRGKAVAAVIEASGADVITLDEVNAKSVWDQIVASTGFHSMWVQGNDGYSVGILSRFPLQNCTAYTQPPIRHAAYGCRVKIGKSSWWIFGVHLYGFDEAVRSQEIALLMSQMAKHPRLPVLLAGDLNAQTPGENEQKTLIAIPELLNGGWIDSFRELYTIQQNPGFTITPPPFGHWERRIDYVFHSKLARAVSAQVISTVPGYTWPSDHAALYVQLINRPPLPTP